MKRFSTIIRSHLGEYAGCASGREDKLLFCLQSAISQLIPHEIIVVADGCPRTVEIVKTDPRFKNIKLVIITPEERAQRFIDQQSIPVFLDHVYEYLRRHPNEKLKYITDSEKETGLIDHLCLKEIHNAIRNERATHSGQVCQAGINAATGEYCNWLDSDDFFGPNHLYNVDYLLEQHGNPKFGYYDIIKYKGVETNKALGKQGTVEILKTSLKKDHIGNGMHVFKRDLNVSYQGLNGYGNDFLFVKRCLDEAGSSVAYLKGKYKKDRMPKEEYGDLALMPEYFICHIPGQFDN